MTSDSKAHDAYAAWRFPSFRLFLMGRFLFLMGTAAQGLAIGWEIYNRTDDPFQLGLVALVKGLPMILFTLPAGWIADTFDRRKVMIFSMCGATVTSLALAWFSWIEGSLWIMFSLLFMDSTFARIGGPSGSAIMPLLLPRHIFENGIKWQTNLFQFTSLCGPALGGLLLSWPTEASYLVRGIGRVFGPVGRRFTDLWLSWQGQTPYLLCAGTSGVFILFLLRMKIPDAPRAKPGNMVMQVMEGIHFVWRRKVVLGAVSLDLFAVLFGGAVYLLPVFARDIIDVHPEGMRPERMLGWLLAAPAAGALFTGVLLAHLPPIRKSGRAMLLGVFGFGVVTVCFGFSTNFWWSWVFLFFTGVFDNISVVVRHTLVNLITPNEMRGRVSAVNSIFIGSSNELGGFESGLVARLFTPVISVVSGGIATMVVVMVWAGLFPRLRAFGSLADVQESEA
ncbi:MAG: MFS transporter [Verrucomicrobia bacterium]|nr:MFS transporter [Verrucomicrobiota bacterium]MCH8514577.1 MFS transporter [Kiritimatiellia bacterium]